MNVLVICICYFLRFVYDFSKLIIIDKFAELRKESVSNNSLYYSIFFFFLLFLVEYLPIVMFNINLNIMYINNITLTPKYQPPPLLLKQHKMQDKG